MMRPDRHAARLFDLAMQGRGREEIAAAGFELVASPGQPTPVPMPGDLVIRRALGEGRLALSAQVASSRANVGLSAEDVDSGSTGSLVELVAEGPHASIERMAWGTRSGRLPADTMLLRPLRRPSAAIPAALGPEDGDGEDYWTDRFAEIKTKIDAGELGAAAKWLNGQSKEVIEKRFLSRLSLAEIAKLHEAARVEPGVGPNSQFAEITRYRFLVHRVLAAINANDWAKAAKYLNGFNSTDIRHRLQRLPLPFVSKLHAAATVHPEVGPNSNLAIITKRSEPYPAFFPGRKSGADEGKSILDGWKETGVPKDSMGRESELVRQLLSGNMPSWLRQWIPIPVSHGTLTGRVFVLPDYLAIGSDTNYIHVPLDKYSAQKVADGLGARLPTARICHAIYLEAKSRGTALEAITRDYYLTSGRKTAPAGWAQTSTAAYREHSEAIQKQLGSLGIKPGQLVAGHKKDVVLSKRFASKSERTKVAFQGFYDGKGYPREPCYENKEGKPHPSCAKDRPALAHPQANGRFADYAQGVRLVHRFMEVDGKIKAVSTVLADSTLAGLISEEGTIDPPSIPPI